MSKLAKMLVTLEELQGRVGNDGLYLTDPFMTMIVTDWETMPEWRPIGEAILQRQGRAEGVTIKALLEGEQDVNGPSFPGLSHLDAEIKQAYRDTEDDLLEQVRRDLVIYRILPHDEFIVFNSCGQELHIPERYVDFLECVGASLAPADTEDTTACFTAEPGIVGFINVVEPELDMQDSANEEPAVCHSVLDTFEEHYLSALKSEAYRSDPKSVMNGLKREFLDVLMQISGFQDMYDRQLLVRVQNLLREIFRNTTIMRSIQFPVRGREYFETTHPRRIQKIESVDGSNYVFISDWDNGYGDVLGTYVPVSSDTAHLLRAKLAHLGVKTNA